MSRVLVTGGAGFIGSHVVDLLIELGIEAIVLDVLHPGAHVGRPEYLNPEASFVAGDIRDPGVVARAILGVDAVAHQAAMVGLGTDLGDAPAYASHNDVGTATLLAELHRARFDGRIVLASSMVVYGEGGYRCAEHGRIAPEPRPPPRLDAGAFEPTCPRCDSELRPVPVEEGVPLDPRNVYAATKVHQEHLCAAFARETEVAVTMLRYHNVYGPRMPRETPYAGVASIFRSALEAGVPPQVFEDGRQLRDFVHVRDVARANVLALLQTEPVRGPVNVASGQPRSVGEMASALSDAFGGDLRPVVTGRYRLGDVRHVFASPGRASRELGFRAEIAFEQGIEEFARGPLRAAAKEGAPS